MIVPGVPRRSRWRVVGAVTAGLVVAGLLVACTPGTSGGAANLPAGAAVGAESGGSGSGPAAPVTAPALPTTSAAPVHTSLTVEASASAVREGTPVTLRFTLSGPGAPVGDATVAVAHAGTTTSADLDASGNGSLILDSLPGGRQQVRVTYAGDSTHAASSGSVVVTVAAITKVAVSTSASRIAPGSPAVARIVVTSADRPVRGAVATVSYAGKKIKTPPTNASGSAQVTLTGLPGGKNRIAVRYPGDATHAPSAATLALTVHAESAISVASSDNTPTAGNPVRIDWTVTAAGRPVAKAPVTITAGGTTVKGTSGADGRGSTELTKLRPGRVPVSVAYAGDAGHGAVSGSVELAVIGSTDVDVYADDRSVTPHDDVRIGFDVGSNAGSISGPVTVSYGGGSHSVDLDGSGHGSVTIPAGALSIGVHTVEVSYPGATFYSPSSESIDISITDNPSCPAWARACVDLNTSLSWLQDDGRIVYGPVSVSSGRPGYRTPAGSFQVYWKDKDHHSSLFDDAPMPNSVFFVGGVAFHEGDTGVMSHGCIHLSSSASQEYWDYLGYGDSVVVYGYAPY